MPSISSSTPPSADGVWHGLCLVSALVVADVPVPDGAQAAVVVQQGQVAWVGPEGAVPAAYAALPHHDGQGALATPGLVDCHTHLVYGGQRANEFAMRLAGASYEEVARAGGGRVARIVDVEGDPVAGGGFFRRQNGDGEVRRRRLPRECLPADPTEQAGNQDGGGDAGQPFDPVRIMALLVAALLGTRHDGLTGSGARRQRRARPESRER